MMSTVLPGRARAFAPGSVPCGEPEAGPLTEPSWNPAAFRIEMASLMEPAPLTSGTRTSSGPRETSTLMVSPRGTLALAAAARARAALHGRGHALPEDVEDLAADALSHRLVPSWRATSEGVTAREIVARTLAHVRPW